MVLKLDCDICGKSISPSTTPTYHNNLPIHPNCKPTEKVGVIIEELKTSIIKLTPKALPMPVEVGWCITDPCIFHVTWDWFRNGTAFIFQVCTKVDELHNLLDVWMQLPSYLDKMISVNHIRLSNYYSIFQIQEVGVILSTWADKFTAKTVTVYRY